MFCPRCNQQQVSDEIRFCPGCGFLLVDVAEALKNNGLVSRNIVPITDNLKKGAAKGLAAMTLSGVFFIISLILGTPEPSYFVQFNLLVGVLCYLFGLIWIAYSFWGKSKENIYTDEGGRDVDLAKFSKHDERRNEPAHRLNEPDLSRVVDVEIHLASDLKTKDLVEQPPSITESTTELLKQKVK